MNRHKAQHQQHFPCVTRSMWINRRVKKKKFFNWKKMRDIQGHLSATDMQYWVMLLHYVLIPNGRWLAEIKLVIRGQVLRHMQNRLMQYLYNWHFVQFWNPFANAPPLWLEKVALDQDVKWLLAFCHLLLDCCWTLLICSVHSACQRLVCQPLMLELVC